MSVKYNNYSIYLTNGNFEMISSSQEFNETKRIIFECPIGHENNMSITSFANKKSKIKNNYDQLCSKCNKEERDNANFELLKDMVKNKSGHVLLEITNTSIGACKYKCGNCGYQSQSTYKNLLKQEGHCVKCNNVKNRKDFQEITDLIESKGMVCLMKPEEYTNNKQKIPMKCICGEEYSAILSDIKKGKNCMKCKTIKYVETCKENYGVENMFQIEEIKEKSKETNLKKRGVEYPQQCPEVRKKTEETCLEKYNVKWAFTKPEVYERIRKTHKEKYGVEYPLQCSDIQKKIEDTFMMKYGVKRPLLSEIFIKKIKKIVKEKYGEEYFVLTNAFKKLMIDEYGDECFAKSKKGKEIMKEKYGSEYYITSSSFKNKMVEKYGVENPMQCPEIFHKAIRSMFSSKLYIFPDDGREVKVMGYENITLDYLLSTIHPYFGEILTSENIYLEEQVPFFRYNDPITGKLRTYYPDIYIKKGEKELIIEVKSVYTYNLHPLINLAKFNAVIRDGKSIDVMIYSDKKKLEDIFEFRPGKEPYSVMTKGKRIPGELFTIDPKKEITSEEDKEFEYEIFSKEIEEAMLNL